MRLRFQLRTLLWSVAVIAVLLFAISQFITWHGSTPLREAVIAFNARARSDPIGMDKPPLTEGEIVRALVSQLPNLDADNQVKATYGRIAKSRRLTRNAALESVTVATSADGKYVIEMWGIYLRIDTNDDEDHRLRIRATDFKRLGIMNTWYVEHPTYHASQARPGPICFSPTDAD